jgi:hypothetical protein
MCVHVSIHMCDACVHMCVVCARVCVRRCVHAYAHVHACVYVYADVCMHVHMCMRVCTQTCACICMHMCVQACVYVCHVCVVCVCVGGYACVAGTDLEMRNGGFLHTRMQLLRAMPTRLAPEYCRVANSTVICTTVKWADLPGQGSS